MSFIKRLFPVFWIALLAGYVLAGVALVPFHADEATIIYTSRDYDYLFLQRDFDKIKYSESPANPAEQELRLLNGTVTRYLIGLAWHSQGLTVDDLNEQWDWGADWNYNQTTGHAPTLELLLIARWSSAAVLAASVVVIFALGQAVGGNWTAYLASLYYALNPAVLLNGRRAMMESPFLFFSLLTVLATVWLLRKPTWPRALLLGLSAGMALASKHTALFTVGVMFGGILLYLVYQSVRSKDETSPVDHILLPMLIITVAVTIGVFLLLNPAWWDDPIGRAQKVLELREDLLAGQSAAFGGYPDITEKLTGFLRQALVALPQYYEVDGWQNWIGDQITRYEASAWRGVSVGGSVAGAVALCVMMAAGFWSLIRERGIADSTRWVMGIWTIAMMLTTLLLTPLEWQRYYLPVYPAIGIVAALGADRMLQRLTRRVIPQNRTVQSDG